MSQVATQPLEDSRVAYHENRAAWIMLAATGVCAPLIVLAGWAGWWWAVVPVFVLMCCAAPGSRPLARKFFNYQHRFEATTGLSWIGCVTLDSIHALPEGEKGHKLRKWLEQHKPADLQRTAQWVRSLFVGAAAVTAVAAGVGVYQDHRYNRHAHFVVQDVAEIHNIILPMTEERPGEPSSNSDPIAAANTSDPVQPAIRVFDPKKTSAGVTRVIESTIPQTRRVQKTVAEAGRSLGKLQSKDPKDLPEAEAAVNAAKKELDGLLSDASIPDDVRQRAGQTRDQLETIGNTLEDLKKSPDDPAKWADLLSQIKSFIDLVNELLKGLNDFMNKLQQFFDNVFGDKSGLSQNLKDMASKVLGEAFGGGTSSAGNLQRFKERLERELGEVTVRLQPAPGSVPPLPPEAGGTMSGPGNGKGLTIGPDGKVRGGETDPGKTKQKVASKNQGQSPQGTSVQP